MICSVIMDWFCGTFCDLYEYLTQNEAEINAPNNNIPIKYRFLFSHVETFFSFFSLPNINKHIRHATRRLNIFHIFLP